MSQPVQNLRHARKFNPLWQGRTGNHQHRHALHPRRVKFGPCAGATCVLGHDQLGLMAHYQCQILFNCERPARHNHIAIRQRQHVRLIHQPQQVVVLGLGREILKMHPTDGQKNTLRRTRQRGNSGGDVGYVLPAIAVLCGPFRAGQRGQRHACLGTCRDRIAAHLRGKRMGGINDMSNRGIGQIARKPGSPTKSTDTHLHRLRARVFHPSRIAIGRRDTQLGHSFGQCVGFGRTAKDQEVGHV